MDVAEASFNEIISQARTQFVVPIWQRMYSWEKKEWIDLLDDLLNLYEKLQKKEQAEHFMGSIVVKTVEEKVGEITRRVLIDGQQRLTTLLLLCALIRNRARIEGNDNLANEIEDSLLFNKYAKGADDKPKLRPTEADRKLFERIISGEPLEDFSEESQLYYAYIFFDSRLFDEVKDKISIEELLKCVRKLKIVTIRLDVEDNPNRIFETLNYRGKELAQSDLIRNYFMMAIKDDAKASKIYSDLWFPMQQNLGSSTLERIGNLELFFRHYIIMNKNEVVKENQVFAEVRDSLKYLDEPKVISELKKIKRYSEYYERLLYPDREENAKISEGLNRLNILKIGVHYPFLLKVYNGYKKGNITVDEFCTILSIIESYVVRRFFYRLPTNSLNRLFAGCCGLGDENLVDSLQNELLSKQSWSAQYWPTDEEFVEKFCTVPVYDLSYSKCRLVLETLEKSLGHPEEVNLQNLTIEHVMPETLSEEWKKHLGDDWARIFTTYLHTIGNLTLIAGPPNSTIQNKLFLEKKSEWYIHSNVGLTRELAHNWNKWTENEISERAAMLADRAVKIWWRPE
ncbi:MAG: DUF262 domain-containing protein [Candidatus Bathyarchaeia archaeon]